MAWQFSKMKALVSLPMCLEDLGNSAEEVNGKIMLFVDTDHEGDLDLILADGQSLLLNNGRWNH